ncbi:hypothetical protein SCLCIDRAFT_113446, partial [Scleroderma citrinum Foug A]
PAHLSLAQVLRFHKVQQIIVVHMYLKGIRSGLKIIVPGLSCFYDGQHLLVMNRIISFGRGHGMQHVHDRSEFTIIAFDANHSPDGELRRIGLKAEFMVLIRVLQDGCSSESSLQGLEQSFLLITEIHHGTTNNSIVLNKVSIEVAKPKEGTDLLDICRLRPLQNSINLFRVHFDPVM